MKQFGYVLVWLSRIHHSLGFGVQSPTDYAFVRSVINEHGLYYAYDDLKEDDWLKRKLGHLYFRLANWRQPHEMMPDDYQRWWHAGCQQTQFVNQPQRVELARIDIHNGELWNKLCELADELSVVVVEGINRDKKRWLLMQQNPRTSVTFDLYYCGIVFFDKRRYKQHYKINF